MKREVIGRMKCPCWLGRFSAAHQSGDEERVKWGGSPFVFEESHLAGEEHRTDGGFSAEERKPCLPSSRATRSKSKPTHGQARPGQVRRTSYDEAEMAESRRIAAQHRHRPFGTASKPGSVNDSVIIMLPKDIAGDMVF